MMKKTFISVFALLMLATSLSSAQQVKETFVLLQTNKGDMKLKLYNETPQHRDNIVKLVSSHFYDGLLFHRVMKDFMIQTGDPNSKNAPKGTQLGSGSPGYTVPAEFNPLLCHKKGALAAARTGDQINPMRASSGSQFYIVQGKKLSDDALNQIEAKINSGKKNDFIKVYLSKPENQRFKEEGAKYQKEGNKTKLDSINTILMTAIDKIYKKENEFKYTQKQRDDYKNIGGTPFLDGTYTVFGEVVEGLNIIDSIAAVKTLPGDRPEEDVKIISAKLVGK